MKEEIPLLSVPGQSMQILLNNQNCELSFTQRLTRIFSDLTVDGEVIWKGLLCHDRSPMKHFRTQNFVGNMVFIDGEGTEDPLYTGLGSRYRLYYYTDDVVLDASFQYDGSKVL